MSIVLAQQELQLLPFQGGSQGPHEPERRELSQWDPLRGTASFLVNQQQNRASREEKKGSRNDG